MKKITILAMVLLMGLCLVGNVFADCATKAECEAKCKEAAKLITEKGVDAAAATINDKNGPFVWKDTYVWVNDLDGNMIAHPIKPSMIGKNWMDLKDKADKLFFKELIEVAKTKSEGWVDYMWPKPGEEKLSEKTSFAYRVPGTNLMTCAGI